METFGNTPVTWGQLIISAYVIIFICIITFCICKWHYKRKTKKKN